MNRSLARVAYAVLLAGAQSCGAQRMVIPPSDPSVAVMGRVAPSPAGLRIGYPGVTLRVRFEGPSLAVRLSSTTAASRLDVRVDGGAPRLIAVPRAPADVTLAEQLGAGPHIAELVHRTETWQGVVTVGDFRLGPGGRLLPPPPWPARRLLFIGDSVTCGEAIDRPANDCLKDPATWNPSGSYGMLLGRALDAQVHLVCFGGRGLTRDWRGKTDVVNAPQFFDLAVPEEHRAPRWDHAAYLPDAVVVSLGTNDFNLDLGAFPGRDAWVAAMVAFVREIRGRYPAAHVFLTEGAIVEDKDDEKAPARPQKTVLRAYLDEAARQLADGRVHVVPSQHYPGDACNAHPTRDQHAAMARDLEPEIRRALAW